MKIGTPLNTPRFGDVWAQDIRRTPESVEVTLKLSGKDRLGRFGYSRLSKGGLIHLKASGTPENPTLQITVNGEDTTVRAWKREWKKLLEIIPKAPDLADSTIDHLVSAVQNQMKMLGLPPIQIQKPSWLAKLNIFK